MQLLLSLTIESVTHKKEETHTYFELVPEGELWAMGIMLECVGICRLDQLSWLESIDRQAEELSE